MGAGYHGGFGNTKGEREHRKRQMANLQTTLNIQKQNKHIIGSKEYVEGKSIITVSIKLLAELVEKYKSTGITLPNGKMIIDFHEPIGFYVDERTGEKIKTTWGTMHNSKTGYHIVPKKPTSKKGENDK